MSNHIRAVSIFLALALCGQVFAAPDPAAEALLKSKGLTKIGLTYLLPGDIQLQEKMRQTRAAKIQMEAGLAKRAELEKKMDAAYEAFGPLADQDDELNKKLKRLGKNAKERNDDIAQADDVESQMRQIGRYVSDLEAQLNKVAIPSDAYVNSLTDLSNSVEAAASGYEALNVDQEVIHALAELNARATAKYRLSPSADLMKNLTLIRKEHGSVRSSAIKFDNGGGTPHLDVLLNNTLHVPMIFDSGASDVSLPWDVAEQLGISPGPHDRTVQVFTANGKPTKVKLMSLKSVQLGPFIAHDVECVVAPKDLDNAPCLLGGSFLKNFVYRMDLAGGQVLLTQIISAPAAVDVQIQATGGSSSPDSVPDAETVAKAICVLEITPDDASASLLVGRYCCFVRGDWADGLPLLVKTKQILVRNLAVDELKNPSDPSAQVAVGDGWWSYGKSCDGQERSNILSHAREYYRKALPGLSSPVKDRVEGLLAEQQN